MAALWLAVEFGSGPSSAGVAGKALPEGGVAGIPVTTVARRPPPAPTIVTGYGVDPFTWAHAVALVEEVRGSAGRITVPEELQHYEDRRWFLALQLADSQEADYAIPHDQAELARMIRKGELTELAPLTDDYILYEVGTDAHEDPLAHYDAESGKDIPLFTTTAEYEAHDERLAREAAGKGRAAVRARETRELLARFQADPARVEELRQERADVTGLAADFGGQAFDLGDAGDRARFQTRLLSFVRPQAREVILALARAYRQEFGRRLPVTSLIRTQRYQRGLARVNRNATSLDVPPHTTGMAFDISYKFMAPDEQNFVMERVAELEQEGRVEALRERRNHIHVYAYGSGEPPPDPVVAEFLDEVEAAHPGSAPRHSQR